MYLNGSIGWYLGRKLQEAAPEPPHPGKGTVNQCIGNNSMLPWVRRPDLEPLWHSGRDFSPSNLYYMGSIYWDLEDGHTPHFALISLRELAVESCQYRGDTLHFKDAIAPLSHRISTRLDVATEPAQFVGTGSLNYGFIFRGKDDRQLGPAQTAATTRAEKVNDSNQGSPWNSTLLPLSQLGKGLTSKNLTSHTTQSPFSMSSTLLMHVLVLFQLLFPRSFWGKSKSWLLLAFVPQALPVAAFRGDRITRTSLLACRQRFTSRTWRFNGLFNQKVQQRLKHVRRFWDPGIQKTGAPHLALSLIALLGTTRSPLTVSWPLQRPV